MTSLKKIFSSFASLQENPGAQAFNGRRDSQMLHGENFECSEDLNGWSRGTSLLDGYTGWVFTSNLRSATIAPTHIVKNVSTIAFSDSNFKLRPAAEFSFLSRVTVDAARGAENGFVKLQGRQLWLPESHLIAIDDLSSNPANITATAMMFAGKPYIYGGRTAQGVDCSGLVQLALQRNGVYCPRDADLQEPVIGRAVKTPRRGDIVYFNDGAALHTGIMLDSRRIINATMRHHAIVVERLDDMQKHYGGIKSIRRLDF